MTRTERRRNAAVVAESTAWAAVQAHSEETCAVCRERALAGPLVMCGEALELYAQWNAAKRTTMHWEARVLADGLKGGEL